MAAAGDAPVGRRKLAGHIGVNRKTLLEAVCPFHRFFPAFYRQAAATGPAGIEPEIS
jgi:hypothetical protein